MNRYISIVFVSVIVLFLTGCGKRIVPVDGKVLFNDQPASNVVVLLEAKGGGKIVPETGMAVTDAGGNFQIQGVDSKRNGVEPGDYTLYLGWKDPAKTENTENPDPNKKANATTPPYQFPKEISDGKFILTVEKSGNKGMVVKFSKDDVTW